VLTTDYTVAGVGAASGSVTLTAPLASGERLTVVRDVPFTQLADYVNNDAFPAESHEDALDLLTMQTQQLKERVDSALTLPPTVTGASGELPSPEPNKLIGWNEAGNALQNMDATTRATIVAFGTSRADTFTGNGTQTQFALTANPGALANLDVSIGGVVQTPGVNYTFSGTTLTFSTAPPLGVGILVRYFLALPQGVTDSAASTFLQAGAGAVTRTVQGKLRDVVSVKDCGAVGDGVADDTAAMQAAHNTGRLVYYPAGTYKFTAITISAGGIIGEGHSVTNLNCVNASSTPAIKYVGAYTQLAGGLVANVPMFRWFTLNGGSLKASGAGIQFDPPSGGADYALIEGVNVSYFPIGIDFVNASLWKIIGCTFAGHTTAGVVVDNVRDNDAGDAVIMGCAFITSSTTADQIRQKSSGGLKIVGNKLLGAVNGYAMRYTGTANTSNLIISANSIENFSSNAISFQKISPGLTAFLNVAIVGNQIAVALASPSAFLIATDSNSWLQNMTISGNVLQLPGVTDSYGIALNSVTCLSIEGNTFRGNGGTSQAIGLTSCVDAKIGNNVYSNITTPYAIVTPGSSNFVVQDSQSGSAATLSSGWSLYYGSLYISSQVTVTFPTAFKVAPAATDVSFTLASGDGSVGVIVNSVSKTQLQFSVLAARTPGFVATVYWRVNGVL